MDEEEVVKLKIKIFGHCGTRGCRRLVVMKNKVRKELIWKNL